MVDVSIFISRETCFILTWFDFLCQNVELLKGAICWKVKCRNNHVAQYLWAYICRLASPPFSLVLQVSGTWLPDILKFSEQKKKRSM